MAPKPRIEKLVVPRFEERQPLEVDFRFSVKGSKDALLEVALNTPLGMVRELVPATLASVEGRRGAGRLGLDLGALPPGASELTLVLVAADGTRGEPASAELEVPGGEGEAPSLLKLRVPERRITRPHDDDVVFGQLVLAAEPGDHELAAAWMRTRRPDGTEVATATAPPSAAAGAEGRVTFASFGAGDELGEYVVSLTLLDASGNQSKTLEAVVELVSRGGAQGPRIKSFAPREAAAGDEVVVRGHGLDPDHLAVEVGGMSAPILASDGAAVRILMPSVDAPGRIVATGPAGTALSGEQLVPRAQVQIVPDEIQVPEGVPLALNAVVTGTTDGSVEWKAQARSGEPGTISSEGLYTPPLGGARGAVTIKAASKSNPDAVGSARVRVVAHPPARGPLPLGPLGGTVRSHDDACALQLPKGALKKLSLIGIETTPPKLDGGAPGGQLVVGGARIDGSTGALGAPAELTLPLPFPLEVGEKVRVQFRDDRREPWKDLPDLAEVIPGEEALKIRLQSLHDYYRGIYEPGPTAPSYLPAITSLTPSALDEGDTAAVLVTGKNFVPGVTTVSVLKWPAGGTEARVETRTVYVTADGTKLGVTLKAGVMADLAEGSIRSVRLRVTTPAGSAERRLDILGHDELVVQGTVTWSQSRTFSRVTIAPGATLRVAHTAPPVTLTAMETIVVGGAAGEAAGLVEVITGSGSSGTDGEAITARGKGGAGGSTAAGLPAVPGGGGAGGDGGTGPRSGPGMPGDGSSGTPGTAPARPAGALRVSAGGGGGLASTWVGGDGVSGSPAPMGLPSALFAPEFISGSGGSGGGGGGGSAQGSLLSVITKTGGGGGGGGAGGGAFALAAGEEIRIRGRVAANGGDGGAGAFPFAVGTPPSAPPFHAGCGGGGGGGEGGCVFLHGVRLLEGAVLAVGGADGRAARFAGAVVTIPDTRTPLQRLLANPQSGLIRIDGRPSASATIAPGAYSVPDLDYRPNLVADAPQVTVQGTTPGTLRVQNTSGVQFVVASGDPFTATVPLAPGFNEIDGVGWDGQTIFAAAAAPRRRRILHLPGVVPVLAFACAISPPSPSVATERSIKLTATVTGTTQTAVSWSVDGGSANGSVAQDGTFRAPCTMPPGPVTVRASSAFDPSRSGTASVTVIAGVAVTDQATRGTPADPAAPSANVGQQITVDIPPALRTPTGEKFAVGQNLEFETVKRDATGTCQTGTLPVTGTVLAGMTRLRATVPPCAAPNQRLRVAGHGCARLQVVPVITSLNRPSNAQYMVVNGSGFACGATEVFFGAVRVAASQVLSVDCNVILLGTRPAAGEQVTVHTAGGTSNPVA